LVARAELAVGPVHALADLARLVVEGDADLAAAWVDAGGGVGVADVGERPAHDALGRCLDVAEDGLVAGLELAGDHHVLIGEQGLAGDAGLGVAGEKGVEDAVGDLVGDLVGVAF